MAARPSHGDTVQGDPAGEHGRRTAGEIAGVHASQPLREPVPHQRVRSRAGPLPSQLHQ